MRYKVTLWIKDFLFNRSFKITFNNTSSKEYIVTSSVPQGSKLAPLLYILHANDIVKIIKNKFAKVNKFANDLIIYAVVNNNENKKNSK